MEVMTLSQGSESERGAEGWRSEFKCETCRAWTGRPPLTYEQVRTGLGENARLFGDYKVTHGCYFCTGDDGEPWHVPITRLEWGAGEVCEFYRETRRPAIGP